MLFSRSQNVDPEDLHIYAINGAQIELVSQYKYLGVWIDDRLTFVTNIENLTKKLRSKIAFSYRNKSCLGIKNRTKMVQTTLLPV